MLTHYALSFSFEGCSMAQFTKNRHKYAVHIHDGFIS